jgi:TatD DNase family protein
MTIRLADTHAHLDLPELLPDQDAVLRRAREAGVNLIINVGIGLENSRQVLATARNHPGLRAAVGVHPHAAASLQEGDLEALTPLAADPLVVAIGEIGLDFYRRRSPEEIQKHWFRQQLEWAFGLKKIVIIHTREATAATLEILQDSRSQLHGGVMHCFGGSWQEARSFLDLGFYLSFAGPLTYPKAGALREVAQQVPLDRILLETDCPYLTPQPWRGKRNEPAYVVATARQMAELRKLSLEEVARATWENSLRVFGLEEKDILGNM